MAAFHPNYGIAQCLGLQALWHRGDDDAIVLHGDVPEFVEIVASQPTCRHHDVVDVQSLLMATRAALLDVRGHQ